MSQEAIYQTTAQLDHDVEALLNEVISTLVSRGVDYDDAAAAIRRVTNKKSGLETPAKKSLQTAHTEPLEEGTIMPNLTLTPPAGYTFVSSEDGSITGYDGPEFYLENSTVTTIWTSKEGFGYFIDTAGNDHIGTEDLRELIPVLQHLVDKADAFNEGR